MLAQSVSCRYNNQIIIVNALLSREWYFSVDLFILTNKLKKQCLFFQSQFLAEPLATSRGTPVEKPCYIALNERVSHEWWIGKGLEGSSYGLILRNYAGIHMEGLRKDKKHVGIVRLWAEIWTQDLPNTKQEC
jgi:hypothetical protein